MPTDTERPAARGWDSPPRGVDLGFRRERLPLCSLLRHTDDRTSTDPARLDHTNYGHRSVRYITPWWLLPTQRHTPQSKPSWPGLPTPWLWEAVTHAHRPTRGCATPSSFGLSLSPSSRRSLLPWAVPVASSRRSPVSFLCLRSPLAAIGSRSVGRAHPKLSVRPRRCRLRSAFD
jgi:hypothetical protein